MNRAGNWPGLLVGALALLGASACSSIFDARSQKESMIRPYAAGDFPAAAELFADKAESRSDTGDALMWHLEAGTAWLDAANPQNAIAAFEGAEGRVREYDDRAVVSASDTAAEAGAILTNPNALPYRGFIYDRVLLNAYKALAYFAKGNFEGGMVEIRRAHERQREAQREFDDLIVAEEKRIAEWNAKNQGEAGKLGQGGGGNAALSFDSLANQPRVAESVSAMDAIPHKTYANLVNPFVTYLSAIGFLVDGDNNSALVDFRNLHRMLPGHPLVARNLVTCAKAIGAEIPAELANVQPFPAPQNRGVVFVVFANGLAAALRQVKIDLILPYVGYTGFAYPELEYFPANYAAARVADSSGNSWQTSTIAEMDAVVTAEYRRLLPMIITRVAISTLAKEIATQAALIAARRSDNEWAVIGAYAATSVYKYMFNTADTRCWQTLPKQYQIAQLPIPADGKLTVDIGGQVESLTLDAAANAYLIYIRATGPGTASTQTWKLR